MRYLLIGLVSAIVVVCLKLLTRKSVPADQDGWRHVTPGLMHWFGALASLAMAGVTTYSATYPIVWETQSTPLMAMIIGFGSAAAFMVFSIYHCQRQAVRWKDDMVSFRSKLGTEQHRFSEIAAAHVTISETAIFYFANGSKFTISRYCSGADEFMASVYPTLKQFQEEQGSTAQ